MAEAEVTLSGELKGRKVFLEGPKKSIQEYINKGFGYWEADSETLELHLIEALYLLEKNKINLYKGEKQLERSDLLNELKENENDFLRYLVYKDLRDRGRIVKIGPLDFLRLFVGQYKPEDSVSRYFIFALSEEKPMLFQTLTKLINESSKLRKELLLAIVNDEGIISYYVTRKIDILSIDVPHLDFENVEAYLYGDRLVIWNIEKARELYEKGFFGHPIGIRKPKSFEFEQPSLLSLYEAHYLLKKKKIKVIDPKNGKELDLESFVEKAKSLRERFDIRCQVYDYWRDKGYVVKSGSLYGVDFIIYLRGPGMDEHSKYMNHVYSESSSFIPLEIIRAGRVATTVRKKLILSLLNKKGEINFYKFSWHKP